MVGSMANPPPSPDCNPEEDIYSEADSDGAGHSYLPPKVFALTWHDDVSHIMHMLPTPSTDSSDLPPHLRQPPLPQLLQRPTQ